MNEEKQTPPETTRLITDWGGNYVTWSWCENCGMPVQYPTEYNYNFCPYCGTRVVYDDGKN